MKLEVLNQYLLNFITFDTMGIFLCIGLVIISVYSLLILSFSVGWIKQKRFKSDLNIQLIPVSIVIACRNENKNILNLLDSLQRQDYSKEHTEIIIVDDNSEDNTPEIISKYSEKFKQINLYKLSGSKKGKKEALALGIKKATSKLIITTDADCIMQKTWISSMVQYYTKYKPNLIVAPVILQAKTIFHKLQALEFLSLIGTGAGAIGIHRPIMCNGANLLFEKSLYLESNLQQNLASGDDIFLLLEAKKVNRKKIHFIKSREAIISTSAKNNLLDFFNQRIRWTSKSKSYVDFDIIFTALVVAITNLILAASLVYSIWNISIIKIFLSLFIIKSIIDLTILIPVTHFFRQKMLLWLFLPLQFIYPFYIILTSILGVTVKFRWKNRKYR